MMKRFPLRAIHPLRSNHTPDASRNCRDARQLGFASI